MAGKVLCKADYWHSGLIYRKGIEYDMSYIICDMTYMTNYSLQFFFYNTKETRNMKLKKLENAESES